MKKAIFALALFTVILSYSVSNSKLFLEDVELMEFEEEELTDPGTGTKKASTTGGAKKASTTSTTTKKTTTTTKTISDKKKSSTSKTTSDKKNPYEHQHLFSWAPGRKRRRSTSTEGAKKGSTDTKKSGSGDKKKGTDGGKKEGDKKAKKGDDDKTKKDDGKGKPKAKPGKEVTIESMLVGSWDAEKKGSNTLLWIIIVLVVLVVVGLVYKFGCGGGEKHEDNHEDNDLNKNLVHDGPGKEE